MAEDDDIARVAGQRELRCGPSKLVSMLDMDDNVADLDNALAWQRRIMRIVDVFLAIPYILLAMGVVFALGPSLLNVILVMGATRWVQFARIVRMLCAVAGRC